MKDSEKIWTKKHTYKILKKAINYLTLMFKQIIVLWKISFLSAEKINFQFNQSVSKFNQVTINFLTKPMQ